MPGGLMQLVSEGQQNIILNGNPSKTFFKSTYAKYTNFGLQKFRGMLDARRTLQSLSLRGHTSKASWERRQLRAFYNFLSFVF